MKTKSKPGGRGGGRARTQTAIVVAFSLLCSVYVAARMVQSSRIRDALVDDLNDADASGAGFGSGASLAGLPRLMDDARATIGVMGGEETGRTLGGRSRLGDALARDDTENENDARDGSEISDGSESGSRSDPFLLGQVDGVARGVVHGWACESGSAPPSSVSVFVDGFLVLTERAARPRGDKAIGRICGRRPAADPSAGFSAPLPALSPGVHEVRVFVGDAGGRFKSELGGSPLTYEEMPSGLALADELRRKDRVIRDQNKAIAQLQHQLGGDADLWSKTEGFGDGASGDWTGAARDGGFGTDASTRMQKHAMHEFEAGAKHAGVRHGPVRAHAVTLASDAGKPGGEERLLAFVGVNTGFASRARRDVLRDTWFPSGSALRQMETQHGLLFRFVIGEPVKSDERLNRDLEAEIARHDDFFRLKHADTYDKLSDKTVMWFSAAVTTVDADFYLKVDDDIHLRVPELERFLVSHRLTRSMYFGCMKSGPVLSNPKQRWHEPEWWRFGDSGNRYFRHCTGQIYGVSRTVAQYIHDHRSILHRFANEDVSVGSWVMGLDVEYVDERNMCCQDCRGNSKCIATFQWRCSGVCDPLTNIPVIHNSCPQHPTPHGAAVA